MPKVETKTVEAISESGDLIEFRVPTKSQRRANRSCKKKNLRCVSGSDQLEARDRPIPHVRRDALANELAYCYDWYLGGHELEVVGTKRGALYEVSSKGYYILRGELNGANGSTAAA